MTDAMRARLLAEKPALLALLAPDTIRAWAVAGDGGWHGIAAGPGWWQWCGHFPTLAQALQAAEAVRS